MSTLRDSSEMVWASSIHTTFTPNSDLTDSMFLLRPRKMNSPPEVCVMRSRVIVKPGNAQLLDQRGHQRCAPTPESSSGTPGRPVFFCLGWPPECTWWPPSSTYHYPYPLQKFCSGHELFRSGRNACGMSIFKYFFHGVPPVVVAPRPAVRPSPAVVLLVDVGGLIWLTLWG